MPGNPIDDRETCHDGPAVAVQPLPAGLSIGACVRVRGGVWRLDRVVPHDDCGELHLRDVRGGGRRVLLWPFDRPVSIGDRPPLRTVRLTKWCRAFNAAVAEAVGPLTPRARLLEGRVLGYQLAPALAIAEGVCRVLLADEVGLGKTIQAGWIVADLLAREPGARILIAVPAGVRHQWAGELSRRFKVHCALADAAWLRGRVADLPPDVSPWAAPGAYLGSIDFLKRGDVARSLQAHAWDLVVVDEAHTVNAPTERHAAFSAIASRARRVALITATPYSGDPAGFASMLALGAAPGEPPPTMFRRSRADVGDGRARRHRFARVAISSVESRLQRRLEQYTGEVWGEAGDAEGARLAMTILRKRALSSPSALSRSLQRRLALLEGVAELPRQLSLFDDEEVDDEVPDGALAAPGLADGAREREWLAALIAAADEAAGHDSKLRYLRRLLRRIGNEPVIVFTEYRDTLLQLASSLPPSLQLHGGLGAPDREAVQSRFNRDGGLLLATDAAAEGLNLQARCRLVVNFELPWNPARLEQRIGRVDRIGQRLVVHAVTLVARDTAEDLVIANLTRRLARVVATLGDRDRLGAFLTDARTARLVIPTTASTASIAHDGGPKRDTAAAVRLSGDLIERRPSAIEEHVAAHLDRARTAEPPPSSIVVSSLRASADLAPGVIVCLRCGMTTSDGQAVSARVVTLHVPCAIARPSSRRARTEAAAAIELTKDVAALVPDMRAWIAEGRAAHATAIGHLLARERALSSRDDSSGAIQPGLFDRRAVARAEQTSDLHETLAREHERRIGELAAQADTQLTCTPVAVLIAWR